MPCSSSWKTCYWIRESISHSLALENKLWGKGFAFSFLSPSKIVTSALTDMHCTLQSFPFPINLDLVITAGSKTAGLSTKQTLTEIWISNKVIF